MSHHPELPLLRPMLESLRKRDSTPVIGRSVQSKLNRAAFILGLLAFCGPVVVRAELPASVLDSPPADRNSALIRDDTSSPDPKDIEDAMICHALLWIRANGVIQAAQIVKSTGSLILDRACLNSAMGQKAAPAIRGGTPVDQWVNLHIDMMMGLPHREAQIARAHPLVPIPRLATDQALNIDGTYYPRAAIAQRKQGVCAMHVLVAADGEVERLSLTQSTGSPDLDTACQDALYAARFVPAQREGKPVAGATDIWIAWHLPK